jgi:hypothetical protein
MHMKIKTKIHGGGSDRCGGGGGGGGTLQPGSL